MVRNKNYIISIDAGTTSVRVVCFDRALRVVAKKQKEIRQYYPKPGWVEHDATEIWQVTERLLSSVLRGRAHRIAAIGITNQRETVVVWDARTGKPVHHAIVWQCRRTADVCDRLRKKGKEKLIRQRTGLTLDAYFSATKIRWILDRTHIPRHHLRCGTIDSWLIWKLTNGEMHATDFTNASRTLLYNIRTHKWDQGLCRLFGVPMQMLPAVKNSRDNFGTYNGIPITGVAGDQQAALFGQWGWKSGVAKNTYGTGCFLLLNIGSRFRLSRAGLLTTLTPDEHGKPAYALEGSVFIGGAVMQWLRDELHMIGDAKESETISESVPDTHGATVVPAFAGLGAPYWDQHARGIIVGLTRGVNWRHIVRSCVESTAFQVCDLVNAMEKETRRSITDLRVDGGATRDRFLLQFQADILQRKILKPLNQETTALGAAMLAGLQSHVWKNATVLNHLQRIDHIFYPQMSHAIRTTHLNRWHSAVEQARFQPPVDRKKPMR